jgi:hypothetical protein
MDGKILAAVDTVAADFRAVVLLVDVEEFSYKEAAEIAGVPIGTVLSRLNRGRKLLKEQLAGAAVSRSSNPGANSRHGSPRQWVLRLVPLGVGGRLVSRHGDYVPARPSAADGALAGVVHFIRVEQGCDSHPCWTGRSQSLPGIPQSTNCKPELYLRYENGGVDSRRCLRAGRAARPAYKKVTQPDIQ